MGEPFNSTHRGRVTHIVISKSTIICSDNGLSPDRCQAIIWTNTGILLIGPLGTNFSKILIKIHTFSIKKMHLKNGKWKMWSILSGPQCLNSLAPGKFEWNFTHVIFKQILVIDDWGISCENGLTWKPQDLTDDKSTLVQVMAWCHQAPSHYLSQCWPTSLLQYGITRPQ